MSTRIGYSRRSQPGTALRALQAYFEEYARRSWAAIRMRTPGDPSPIPPCGDPPTPLPACAPTPPPAPVASIPTPETPRPPHIHRLPAKENSSRPCLRASSLTTARTNLDAAHTGGVPHLTATFASTHNPLHFPYGFRAFRPSPRHRSSTRCQDRGPHPCHRGRRCRSPQSIQLHSHL